MDNKKSSAGPQTVDVPVAGDILFVDDEANILKALRRLFMDEECEVFTAASGDEALRILGEKDGIGVIVSDQRMPGMSGVDFLERSKTVAPLAVRILLTGYADISAAVDAINRGGASRYLAKPWNDEELVQAVREAMRTYFLIKENRRLNELIKKQNAELEIIVQEQTMELQKNYDDMKMLNARLRESFKSTIIAFSGLLDLRDKNMRSHSKNVAAIAARVAMGLEMPSDDRETMVIAALLHDIGKLGIPDVILKKDPDHMNREEKKEYELHPVRGQAAVDAIEDLRKAGVIIRHHHERYDGQGFPDQIRRKDIPLAARIIAAVDFIDNRVRRFENVDALGVILRGMRKEGGKRFDARIIPAVEEEARKFYRQFQPKTRQTEMEFYPDDLEEGMVVSRDVYTGTGILLLSKGTELDKVNILLLKRYSELDPSKRGVFVVFNDSK